MPKVELKKDNETSGLIVLSLDRGEQAPVVSEVAHKSYDWIFYGNDNLFPQKLITLADNSAIHNSLIQAKKTWTIGEGVEYGNSESFWKENFEKQGITEREFISRLATDIVYFGGYYFNVIYDQKGRIAEVHPIDFSEVRASKELDKRKPASWWVSRDWEVASRKKRFTGENEIYKPEEIRGFNPLKFRDSLSKKHGQIMIVKDYKPSKYIYPEPDYMGALNWIEISSQIGDYNKNLLNHGMMGNTHIHVYEDLSDNDKRKEYERGINKKFGGADSESKIILTWSTDQGKEPLIAQIPSNDSHEMFMALNRKTSEEIVSAHRFQPQLAGIDISVGLGGKGLAINESIDLVQNYIIKPFQLLIESGMNKINALNGLDPVEIVPISNEEMSEKDGVNE